MVEVSPLSREKAADRQIADHLVQIVRGRLSLLTGKQAKVRRNGRQIRADLPGFTDLARVRALLAPPQPLELHLVDEKVSQAAVAGPSIPPDVEIFD